MHVEFSLVFLIAIANCALSFNCETSAQGFDRLQDIGIKWTTRWLSKSSVRICNCSVQVAKEAFQFENIDIWHVSSNTIELCTSVPNHELEKRYPLQQCREMKKLKELVNLEDINDSGCFRKRPHHMIHSRAINNSNVTSIQNKSDNDDILTLKWFDRNHNLSDIETWYNELASRYSDLVYINKSIGLTRRGIDIFAVHISHGQKPSSKPKIYLQCLLHAREWISGSVCMYISLHLVQESNKKQVSKLLNQLEFILVPVANPDGYALTWFRYPLYRHWRKNFARFNNTHCIGVDLNRNFDIHWNESGTSSDPCNTVYSGPSAQSEPEVQAITAYVLNNKPVYGAIDIHSYGQYVLYPYGWTSDLPIHIRRLQNVARRLSESIEMVNGTFYMAQSMGSVYLASGTFGDWVYKEEVALQNQDSHNLSYFIAPVTMELRPKEAKEFTSGFLVNPEDILPTCREMIPAIKQFSKKLLKRPLRFSETFIMK